MGPHGGARRPPPAPLRPLKIGVDGVVGPRLPSTLEGLRRFGLNSIGKKRLNKQQPEGAAAGLATGEAEGVRRPPCRRE